MYFDWKKNQIIEFKPWSFWSKFNILHLPHHLHLQASQYQLPRNLSPMLPNLLGLLKILPLPYPHRHTLNEKTLIRYCKVVNIRPHYYYENYLFSLKSLSKPLFLFNGGTKETKVTYSSLSGTTNQDCFQLYNIKRWLFAKDIMVIRSSNFGIKLLFGNQLFFACQYL